MPVLSSAQILLVLWLLAVAVAPAATALVNGSLAPFANELREVRCDRMVVTVQVQDEEKQQRAAAVVHGLGAVPIFQQAEGASERVVALAWMNTGVQRHRPRLA
jgi:hypothetical protein